MNFSYVFDEFHDVHAKTEIANKMCMRWVFLSAQLFNPLILVSTQHVAIDLCLIPLHVSKCEQPLETNKNIDKVLRTSVIKLYTFKTF